MKDNLYETIGKAIANCFQTVTLNKTSISIKCSNSKDTYEMYRTVADALSELTNEEEEPEDAIIIGKGGNTKISYPLRIIGDPGVEEWCSVVIPGRMTQEQAKTILNCVDAFFDPRTVGFPSIDIDKAEEYFYELEDDCFDYTDEKPNLNITPSQLMNKFVEAIR